MKWFCPWCDCELESNRAGATHTNPNMAWLKLECEYQVGDVSAHFDKNYPISELEREEYELEKMVNTRRGLTHSIKEQRITINKLQREWEKMNNGKSN